MSARFLFAGALREVNGGKVEALVEHGQTVRAALVALGVVPEIIALVVVNERVESKDYIINEGDIIQLRAVIGGG